MPGHARGYTVGRYVCTVNEVGPASDGSETPAPVVYINLTDTDGAFENFWFYAANGIQQQLLDVGISAIAYGKDVVVGVCDPNPGNSPFTEVSRIFGFVPPPPPLPPAPALVTSAELSAAVEALPQDPSNSGLLIKGTNFGANETVAVAVEWTAVASTGPHMLAPLSTDWAGSFEVWFTGDNPDGLCPILVAAGQPQPAQFFFVCASGQSSKQTVSASAGPFTCGFG